MTVATETPWVEPHEVTLASIVKSVAHAPARVLAHRDFVAASVVRELGARFRGTLLGWAWPLLTPLFLFGVYYFIFTRLLGLRMPAASGASDATLGVYMFTGTLVWTGFAEGLSRATTSVVESRGLIQKVAFPSDLLPLNSVLVHALTMLAGLAMFVLLCAATPVWRAPTSLLLWAPVVLFLQIVFTYGLGALAASLHVFVRDTQPVLALLLGVWMFATPVFWVPVPELLPGIGAWTAWIEWNPAYHLLYVWRTVLMSSEPALCFPHAFERSLWFLALAAAIAFAVGYGTLSALRGRFADEV